LAGNFRLNWSISNDADHVKSFFFSLLQGSGTLLRRRTNRVLPDPLLFICVTLTCSARFPFINSVLPTKHLFDHDSTMMSYSNSLLFREAGSLINRPVTFRTMASFWHPRTGTTVFLTPLSTTTELVVINLVPQHNPQPDPQFASYGDPSFSQSFLDQFAAVETL
jgi:hypothetical protein